MTISQARFALEHPSPLRECDGTDWLVSSNSGTSEGSRYVVSEDLFALSVKISFDDVCRNPQLLILSMFVVVVTAVVVFTGDGC